MALPEPINGVTYLEPSRVLEAPPHVACVLHAMAGEDHIFEIVHQPLPGAGWASIGRIFHALAVNYPGTDLVFLLS